MRIFEILRTLIYTAVFVATWAWVATLVRPLDARLAWTIPAAVGPAGWVLAIPGGALALASALWFAVAGRGTPAPFDAPREFVASGPYRYVRNPMYIGAAMVIAGAGLIVGSPAIVLLTVGFLLFFHVFVLVYEEPTLREKFGQSYRDYCARVRRWLPRFRVSASSG